MICWYCHWGWPKQVSDIYHEYLKLTNEQAMHYGPAHIVWEDENFETNNVQWCIDNYKKYPCDTSKDTLLVVESLRKLLEIPEEIRCCVPNDYDGENPKNYPPPSNIIMIRK